MPLANFEQRILMKALSQTSLTPNDFNATEQDPTSCHYVKRYEMKQFSEKAKDIVLKVVQMYWDSSLWHVKSAPDFSENAA